MAQNYKQWIIAVVFVVIVLAIVFSKIRSEKKTDETAPQSYTPPISQSLVEFNAQEKQLLALIEKDPSNVDLHSRLGDLYFESNRYVQAIPSYLKALELNPADADTYNDLGLAYHYSGEPTAAVEALKKGTEAGPSYQRIWLSLGFVLAAQGNTVDARRSLNKAIELSPDSEVAAEARRILGLIK